jgi:hypothetical protein
LERDGKNDVEEVVSELSKGEGKRGPEELEVVPRRRLGSRGSCKSVSMLVTALSPSTRGARQVRSEEQRTGGTGSILSEIVGDDLGLLRSLPFRSFSDRMRKRGIVAVAGRKIWWSTLGV